MFDPDTTVKRLRRTVASILLATLISTNVFAGSPPPPPPPPPYQPPKDNGSDAALIGGAIGGALALGGLLWWLFNRGPSLQPPDRGWVDRLKHQGPEIPPAFALYGFSVKGLVKGNWPMVMDYSLAAPEKVEIAVSAQGAPEIYTFTLSSHQMGRRQMKWELPKELGDELRPALITIKASDTLRRGGAFDLIGFGAGPKAVGSIAIDQLLFSPDGIRASNSDTALYRFFSHSDFENASAEFRKIGSGDLYMLVNSQPIEGGLRANRWVGEAERRVWDGFDTHRQVSVGRHKLQVRAWHSEGDWVTAMSNMSVSVSQ